MARTATPKNRNGTERKIAGLGFLPVEARHGFLIEVPKGQGRNDWICIAEYRNVDLTQLESIDGSALGSDTNALQPLEIGFNQQDGANPRLAPNLRVLIDRTRWLALAPAFYEEANRRLRANGLPAFKFQKNPSKPANSNASVRLRNMLKSGKPSKLPVTMPVCRHFPVTRTRFVCVTVANLPVVLVAICVSSESPG